MDFLDKLCYSVPFFLCFFVDKAFLPSFCHGFVIPEGQENRQALSDKQIIMRTFAL